MRFCVAVRVPVTVDVTLDALSELRAKQVATYMVTRAEPARIARLSVEGNIVPAAAQAIACSSVPDNAQRSTFVCGFCGVESLKSEWGPGWIVCPRCDRRALTASEVAAS